AGEGAALDDVSACAVQAVLMTWLGSHVQKAGRSELTDGPGALSGIAKLHDSVTISCSDRKFEGEGLIQFNIEAPPSCVRDVVKDVMNLLKNFKIHNLQDIKNRAKENIIRSIAKQHPAGNAIQRSKEIFAGVKRDAVLGAIDNVSDGLL
ncbi:hypothetical protein PMAYCL1PPCAC_20453, partial [Pristionchus mayeri]